MLAIYLARCVNPLNFATRDLIYSCYASNSSNSCLQDERYRAAEFMAGLLGNCSRHCSTSYIRVVEYWL